MLTERQLTEILYRLEPGQEASLHVHAHADLLALTAEIERLANQLSDCWLILDALATAPIPGILGGVAERTLRQQRVPGWTNRGTAGGTTPHT